MVSIEILIIGFIIFFILNYTGKISANKLMEDNKEAFKKFKESDYDFYVRAKYGISVDPDNLFSKRIKNGVIILLVLLFVFITDLNYKYILVSLVVAFIVFKADYMSLKNYYKTHLHQIDLLLPYYLKSLEVLIQHYTVPVAIGKSITDAPEIFKQGLADMIEQINMGDATIEPYMEFARKYPVRDSMRMMRLLFRLSLGKQERKQEQLLTFSRTISNLQQKARETRYKERLEKMEKKTMSMLITTGVGVMILIVVSVLIMFNM